MKRLIRRLFGSSTAPLSGWDKWRDYVLIHPSAIIAPSATLTLFAPPSNPRIMVEIGADTQLFGHLSLLRPSARIVIGERCQIGASRLIAAESITVGDDTLLAWDIDILDSDTHSTEWTSRRNDVLQCGIDYRIDPANLIRNKDWSSVPIAPVVIGPRSWIGLRAIILKGVELGAETVVGAGAVVTQGFPPGSKIAGNPAQSIHPS
ncbi:acyltransferase [Kamptonema cortianum]|nr:acyltransferase [Oscillatoria laete-virens]MDK3155391.1 acyltransferase [Kamptonema cortianum]MDL5046140.1 acyltransferase [Oscillatoria amoena NRMC-F 0135]MDL5052839.1 acyltransferase [Oscillatoria laete-virens NRMC-F 0139]